MCYHCRKNPRRGESLFCSEECKAEYAKIAPESIECFMCDAQADGITSAIAAGWKDIEQDLEGYGYNYLGYCPACQKEEENL